MKLQPDISIFHSGDVGRVDRFYKHLLEILDAKPPFWRSQIVWRYTVAAQRKLVQDAIDAAIGSLPKL